MISTQLSSQVMACRLLSREGKKPSMYWQQFSIKSSCDDLAFFTGLCGIVVLSLTSLDNCTVVRNLFPLERVWKSFLAMKFALVICLGTAVMLTIST